MEIYGKYLDKSATAVSVFHLISPIAAPLSKQTSFPLLPQHKRTYEWPSEMCGQPPYLPHEN